MIVEQRAPRGFEREGSLYRPVERQRVLRSSYLPPRERERRAAPYGGPLGLDEFGVLGASGGSWTPASIPNLTLHLDAAVGVVTTTDSGDAGSELDLVSWTDLTGAKVFSAVSVAPNYRASDANAGNQPSIVFDVADSRLQASASIALAWFAAVAWYPSATFLDFDPLMAARSPLWAQVLRGNSGTADWRTADIAGTRYRDGSATDTALTGAGQVHLYEFVPTTPIAGTTATWEIGRESSSRYWRAGICLMLAASAVPSSGDRNFLRAYSQARFGSP